MKKIIYAISALAVIMAVGCSKENVDTPSLEYKLVVNMDKPSFGDDTRAARTSWENGDVVYIVFNDDISTAEKYLTLTYNAGSWTSNWVGTTAADVVAAGDGTLMAGYTNGKLMNNFPKRSDGSDPKLSVYTDDAACVMVCDNGTYTVSGSTITLNITMKHECAQVTVRGLNVEGDWMLRSPELVQIEGFSIYTDGVYTANGYNGETEKGYLTGFANADGVSFYGARHNTTSAVDYTFYLTNGEKTYTRTFANKQLPEGMAIIMDGPDSGKWTEVTE